MFIPLLQQQFPEIVDFWLPPEGCSYRIAVVSMKKAYPGHAKRVMMGVWSFLRQFVYTKFVIVVDDDIDARNWKDVMWAVATRMDPARDITVVENTPIDYLDFASPDGGLGGKIGLDATNKWPGETTREWGRKLRMSDDVVAAVTEKWPSLGLPGSGKPIWRLTGVEPRVASQLDRRRALAGGATASHMLASARMVKDRGHGAGTATRSRCSATSSRARPQAGADAADAVLFEGASLSHAQRLGRIEKLERSESYDLGLRVLIGKRQAIVSSNERGTRAHRRTGRARHRHGAGGAGGSLLRPRRARGAGARLARSRSRRSRSSRRPRR